MRSSLKRLFSLNVINGGVLARFGGLGKKRKKLMSEGTFTGFIVNLENLENRPFLQKIRENLEWSGSLL